MLCWSIFIIILYSRVAAQIFDLGGDGCLVLLDDGVALRLGLPVQLVSHLHQGIVDLVL